MPGQEDMPRLYQAYPAKQTINMWCRGRRRTAQHLSKENAMNKKTPLLVVLALAVAALACAVPSLPGGDGSLFKDDFSSSDSGWGTGTDSESSVEYAGGALVMQVFLDNYL